VVVLAGPATEADVPQANVAVHRIAAHYDPPGRLARMIYWRAATFAGRAHPIVAHWMRWNLASVAALEAIHRRTPLDVIEAPEHAANGLFVARARRWPTVIRVHGPWDLFYGLNRTKGTAMNRMLTALERRSLKYADVVTTPSRTMAEMIARKWRLPRVPKAVPNFMDVPGELAPLPAAGEAPRIVCAGRLEGFKGQDTLVKAFAIVGERHPTAELHLIGPDQWSPRRSFASWVDRWVARPEVRRRVILHGPRPLTVVQEELRRATLAVICSTGFESFSFSTLEAMAAGRAIVGSRSGAIPELLDEGRCGAIAERGDTAAFAAEIEGLLGDRALCERLGAAAHARARAVYDTGVVIPQMIREFERARG
jgi:glycosyltransferase involved in cell wall biosynthesis